MLKDSIALLEPIISWLDEITPVDNENLSEEESEAEIDMLGLLNSTSKAILIMKSIELGLDFESSSEHLKQVIGEFDWTTISADLETLKRIYVDKGSVIAAAEAVRIDDILEKWCSLLLKDDSVAICVKKYKNANI